MTVVVPKTRTTRSPLWCFTCNSGRWVQEADGRLICGNCRHPLRSWAAQIQRRERLDSPLGPPR